MNLDCCRGLIVARGSQREIAELTSSGGTLVDAGTVTMPANRVHFMTVEAVGRTEQLTDRYLLARREAMSIDDSLMCAAMDALSAAGFDYRHLMAHQIHAVALALMGYSSFNGSEQGTGKTRSTLAALAACGAQRTVIVCPKSLVSEWREEAIKIDLPISVTALGSGPVNLRVTSVPKRRDVRYPTALILNYEALSKMERAVRQFDPDAVVFDESWRLKNRRAKTTTAAKRISRMAQRRIELTGTAVGNHVGDLFSQIELLSPGSFGMTYEEFIETFAEMGVVRIRGGEGMIKIIGAKSVSLLMSIIDPIWFRATKLSCLDLPPKLPPVRIKLRAPRATTELYREVCRIGENALGSELSLSGSRVTLLRLQQIAGGHRPVVSDDPEIETRLERLPCPKVDWLRQFAEDRLVGDPSMRALVWCRFTSEIVRIREELEPIVGRGRIVEARGGIGAEELDEAKRSFNSRDPNGVQVLVCQIKKMACGHNLQAADVNVYFNHSWSYLERAQSEDRSHRLGRTAGVQYFDLVLSGSIDECVLNATDRKEDLAMRMSPDTAGRWMQ